MLRKFLYKILFGKNANVISQFYTELNNIQNFSQDYLEQEKTTKTITWNRQIIFYSSNICGLLGNVSINDKQIIFPVQTLFL